MDAEPDIGRIARTIGDPTRIRMLTLLMEGRALTAKELAHGSGVQPATATAHLGRLLGDALVMATTQGRHKYFRLASSHVAQCVESLLTIAPPAAPAASAPPHPIRQARFCYDHLAGRLGIQITEALLQRGMLRLKGREFTVSPKGDRWFAKLGIEISAVERIRRKFACGCLDWSERKDHLGGALGAALAQRLLDRGWLKRQPGTRVVLVTKLGGTELASHLGIEWK
jgi:DNA-binding transcriptional ArsR family regulator